MGNGLNLGSMSSYYPNPWQYAIFPQGTSSSVMSPSDPMTVSNDSAQLGFDYDVTSLLYGSNALANQLIPMMKKWQAQQAEMYQKFMTGISSGTNTNIESRFSDPDKIDGTRQIKDTQVADTIAKMGASSGTAERMNKEITYKDKNGKEQKTTLLRRLIELSKQYIENPDDPDKVEISDENFKKVWDIAGKFAKTGELSREDYKTLIDIAKNPGGASAADEKDKKKDKKAEPVARSAAYADGHAAAEGNAAVADTFLSAMDGAGTNKGEMKSACESTSKYNVIEVFDKFKSINSYSKGESWIDAVFDDCDNWGSGESKWYCFGCDDDDAKPFVEKLSTAMIERASDIKDLENCSDATKNDLNAKAKALQAALTAADNRSKDNKNSDLSEELQNNIKKAFKDLHQALKNAENEEYGKEK